jgi:hypothetical protein
MRNEEGGYGKEECRSKNREVINTTRHEKKRTDPAAGNDGPIPASAGNHDH